MFLCLIRTRYLYIRTHFTYTWVYIDSFPLDTAMLCISMMHRTEIHIWTCTHAHKSLQHWQKLAVRMWCERILCLCCAQHGQKSQQTCAIGASFRAHLVTHCWNFGSLCLCEHEEITQWKRMVDLLVFSVCIVLVDRALNYGRANRRNVGGERKRWWCLCVCFVCVGGQKICYNRRRFKPRTSNAFSSFFTTARENSRRLNEALRSRRRRQSLARTLHAVEWEREAFRWKAKATTTCCLGSNAAFCGQARRTARWQWSIKTSVLQLYQTQMFYQLKQKHHNLYLLSIIASLMDISITNQVPVMGSLSFPPQNTSRSIFVHLFRRAHKSHERFVCDVATAFGTASLRELFHRHRENERERARADERASINRIKSIRSRETLVGGIFQCEHSFYFYNPDHRKTARSYGFFIPLYFRYISFD